MAWLVTGGAGYIGAHVVRALQDAGVGAVVLDDLSSGHEGFVPPEVPFVRGSILDRALLDGLFREHAVTGVVHVAGYKYAGVSVQRPLHTYEQNVTGTAVLLAAMAEAGVGRIVFSSSAAVYGTPDTDLVTESTPKAPESPYGESKLIGEWLLRDQGVAAGLAHTSLRYFNVVGSGEESLYDSSPHNLFPLIFEALIEGRTPKVFGDDYPTPDGTCVRDYIHVADLALAHVAAARRLDAGEPVEPVYNLGSGDGVSVGDIMRTVARVTGQDFTPETAPRRPGDPARIVASGELAARDLGWAMRHDLDDMVRSAWSARRAAAPAAGLPGVAGGLERVSLVAFDLDDTLAASKSPMDPRMADLLVRLLDRVPVCIISGGQIEQFRMQVVDRLGPLGAGRAARFHLMPTCGTQYWRFGAEGLERVYAEDLTEEEKSGALAALEEEARRLDVWEADTWGPILEDRGSQITFSALGQDAPVDAKKAWDPTGAKRDALSAAVQERLPGLEVRSGGSTSVDITRRGIDKAYGMRRLAELTGVPIEEMLFVGDRLDPAGNDYPVKAMGVVTHAVDGWEETAEYLEALTPLL